MYKYHDCYCEGYEEYDSCAKWKYCEDYAGGNCIRVVTVMNTMNMSGMPY